MTMKQRLARYLERHYDSFTESDVEERITQAIARLASKEYLTAEAIMTSLKSMRQEGWTNRKILAHLNMIDIEDRT
jgi:hypothetical protein